MAAEQIYPAIVASPGLVRGPLFIDRAAAAVEAEDSPEEALDRLTAAAATARQQLERLAAEADGDAREILEFQIELLGDPELIAPARAAVEAGAAAASAWRTAIGSLIEDYESDDDHYFQARATDLKDLRDRVLRALSGDAETTPRTVDGIYVAEDLAPSRFLEIDWSRFKGAALTGGSTAGHVAILARARGVPMLIGLEARLDALGEGTDAVLDAEDGRLVVAPTPGHLDDYQARIATHEATLAAERALLPKPAITASGARVAVMVNVDDPAVLDAIDPAHCDGIGLARSELQFYGPIEKTGSLPDEETQYRLYSRLVTWADGRPVTVRTLDAGADKPIPGLTREGETNPFLGVRGLRLSLARPEVFKVQLRALARAAAEGTLKVMFPMVTAPWEFDAACEHFDHALAELRIEGAAAAMPALGMMVEVPAAALGVARFDADFFSIGSNDLIQYVTAVNREEKRLVQLFDPLDPGVLELIARVADHGRGEGKEVSLCGDMASDPRCIPALLQAGLRSLSVAPAALGRAKAAVAAWDGKG